MQQYQVTIVKYLVFTLLSLTPEGDAVLFTLLPLFGSFQYFTNLNIYIQNIMSIV